MKPSKHLKRTFTKQQEHSDCGVACLLSIIKFHAGDGTIESLRELSGTNQEGTTLLGLYQTAQKIGFDTKGVKSSTEAIQQLQLPCILHVNIDDKRLHYLVCYEQKGEEFLVGDPAEGLKTINKEELNHIWQSKSVLELKPNPGFKTQSYVKKQKQNWLKDFIGNDYITLLVSSIIGVLSTVLGLTLAMFNQKLIDDILPEKDIKLFTLIISLVAFLLLARVGLNYLRSFVLQKQNKIFNNRMLGSFFEKLLYLPIGFFESRRTGELIARMNDAQKIQQTISLLIGSVVIDLLMAIVFTIAIFYYHTGLGILSILFIPFIVLWTYKMSKTISAKQKKVMLAYADNESNYIQKLKEIDAIKVFQKEEKSIEETTSIYQKFQEEAFSLGITSLKFSFPLQVLGIVYSLSIISYATFLIFDDVFTIGQLTAILTISASIFPAIVRIVSANVQIQGGKVAFNRMFEITSVSPESSQNESEDIQINTESIHFKQVSFRFAGRKALIQNATMDLQKGQITALLGESGSGKTTIFKILQKFYTFESGKIQINQETDWSAISHTDWRKQLATVPQEVALLNATLSENIAFEKGNKEQLQKVVEFCKTYGFEKYFSEFPQDYFTKLGEEGVNISGGQKQLVGFARALFSNCQVLLLDEPTSSMDVNMSQFAMDLLHQIKKEKLIFLITHENEVANQADKIYRIESGEVEAR